MATTKQNNSLFGGNYYNSDPYYNNYNNGYPRAQYYGAKSKMYSIPTGHGFDTMIKEDDPYFNLGSILGSLWGVNYNQRGAKKSADTAQKMFDEYTKTLDGQNQQQQEQPKEPSMYDKWKDAFNNGNNWYQETDGKGIDPNAPAPTSDQVSAKLQYFGKNGQPGPALQTPGLKDVKFQYTVDRYINRPDGDPNPVDTQKVGGQAGNAVGGDISNIDVTKLGSGFDANTLRNNIIAKLRAAGRNDYQISEAMKQIDPAINAKAGEYNQQAFNDMYGKYQQLIKGGDYDNAGILLAKIYEIYPTVAKALGQQYTRGYNKFAKNEELRDKIKLIKEADPELSDREALAAALGYSKGGRGLLNSSGGGRNPKGSDIFAADPSQGLTKRELEMYKFLMGKKDEDLKQEDRDMLATLKSKVYASLGLFPPGAKQRGVDYSNYDHVHAIADASLRKLGDKYTAEDVLKIAKELRAKNTDMADKVAQEFEDYAGKIFSYGFNTDNQDGEENTDANYQDYGDLAQDIKNGVPRNIAWERAQKRTGIKVNK